MPVVAACLQASLNIAPVRSLLGSQRFELIVCSYALSGLWLWFNVQRQPVVLRRSAGLVATGWTCNIIAILGNGGMPVSRAALRDIDGSSRAVQQGNLWKHVLASPHAFAPWLGDCIPVPIPVLRNVISVGDVLMLMGCAWGLQFLCWHRTGTRSPAATHEGPIPLPAMR
jgi:hypothetical protein